jgi:hypothetical protein
VRPLVAAPPADEDLRARFARQQDAFEGFVALLRERADLQNRDLVVMRREDLASAGLEPATLERVRPYFTTLNLDRVEWRGGDLVHFVVWFHDLPGPGYHVKGYAYAEDTPIGEPRRPDVAAFTEYTPLGGRWYLYEHLID